MLNALTMQKGENPGTKGNWELLDSSITLFVIMVSLVFAYVQSHQIIYIEGMQFILCQLHFSKEA